MRNTVAKLLHAYAVLTKLPCQQVKRTYKQVSRPLRGILLAKMRREFHP